MEEVHEEIGYWMIHSDWDSTTKHYINQYGAGSSTLAEFNFLEQSDRAFHQLAVF